MSPNVEGGPPPRSKSSRDANCLSSISFSQTLIETHVDVRTTDGYLLRVFVIGFTKKRPNQVKKTCYAQSSQCRQIRRRMTEIVQREISNSDIREVVNKL